MIRIIAVELNDRHARCQVRDGFPPHAPLAGEITLDRATWDQALDDQHNSGNPATVPVLFEVASC